MGDPWGHINTKFRDGLIGGPCIPYFRHVSLEPGGNYQKCVYYTPSGERFKYVTSYDFNGMICVFNQYLLIDLDGVRVAPSVKANHSAVFPKKSSPLIGCQRKWNMDALEVD